MSLVNEQQSSKSPPQNGNESHPQRSQKAPLMNVPREQVVCIEHPCIIKDVDKGIKSLGGEYQIKDLLLPNSQPASVSLRPDDPFARKLFSREADVNNLLVRVTLPKRTGRKRKRGSDGPFLHDDGTDSTSRNGITASPSSLAPLDGAQMLQSLSNNQGRYSMEPIGLVKSSHRFRSLPDFQLRSGDTHMLASIKSHLLKPTVASIKSFMPHTRPEFHKYTNAVGPPQFTKLGQGMNYAYEQNPGVKLAVDEQGNAKMFNIQAPRRRDIYGVPADTKTIPMGPPATLPPVSSTNKWCQQAVQNLRKLLQDRPIATRRVAMNMIDWGSETLFKDATQYVGYSFRSGPWKDALVRYGIDPRTDPKYRFYQTITFQLLPKDKATAESRGLTSGNSVNAVDGKWLRGERYTKATPSSHIFTGASITTNGKTWQICDIEEPTLHQLLHRDDGIRTTCDPQTWGWYPNGTLASARIVMRDMIHILQSGRDPSIHAAVYTRIATDMPAEINDSTLAQSYMGGKFSATVGKEAGNTPTTPKKAKDPKEKGKGPSEKTGDERLAELTAWIRQLAKSDVYQRLGGTVQRGPNAGKAKPGFGITGRRDGDVHAEGETGTPVPGGEGVTGGGEEEEDEDMDLDDGDGPGDGLGEDEEMDDAQDGDVDGTNVEGL